MHRNKVDTKSADTIFAQVFIYEKKQTEAQILNPRNKVDTKSVDTIFAQVFSHEKKQTEAQILSRRNKVDTKSVDTIFAQVFIYESLDRMTDIRTTYHHFLGFKFLVRNEEKNEIPCRGTRKIQGIS